MIPRWLILLSSFLEGEICSILSNLVPKLPQPWFLPLMSPDGNSFSCLRALVVLHLVTVIAPIPLLTINYL